MLPGTLVSRLPRGGLQCCGAAVLHTFFGGLTPRDPLGKPAIVKWALHVHAPVLIRTNEPSHAALRLVTLVVALQLGVDRREGISRSASWYQIPKKEWSLVGSYRQASSDAGCWNPLQTPKSGPNVTVFASHEFVSPLLITSPLPPILKSPFLRGSRSSGAGPASSQLVSPESRQFVSCPIQVCLITSDDLSAWHTPIRMID